MTKELIDFLRKRVKNFSKMTAIEREGLSLNLQLEQVALLKEINEKLDSVKDSAICTAKALYDENYEASVFDAVRVNTSTIEESVECFLDEMSYEDEEGEEDEECEAYQGGQIACTD